MPEELKSSIEEYLALWKEYGIETHPESGTVLEKMLSKSITSGEASSAPAKISSLSDVRAWIGDCRRCRLCEGRTKIVFGTGNPSARLMFVGEGPGADEDAQGEPFVGRAGKLLTKIIEAMGYQRSEVYIANIVKCRPPKNRAPLPDEAQTCLPFLKAQIALVQPSYLVALGSVAATHLLGQNSSISSLRGKFHPLPWDSKLKLMPTYHPAYLLRNPNAKRIVWDDMKMVKAKLENA